MNPEDDVIDRIDELVNESLAKSWDEKSGYDNNIHQDTCGHCGGDWHGLQQGSCPGSTFIGPRRPPTEWVLTVGGQAERESGYSLDALQALRQTIWPNPLFPRRVQWRNDDPPPYADGGYIPAEGALWVIPDDPWVIPDDPFDPTSWELVRAVMADISDSVGIFQQNVAAQQRALPNRNRRNRNR